MNTGMAAAEQKGGVGKTTACELAGITTMPVIIRNLDDKNSARET